MRYFNETNTEAQLPVTPGTVQMNRAPSIPLSMARSGESGIIVRISGNADAKRFLSELGFTVGSRITTLSDTCGSKILSIRDSKIALDGGMASRIMICPE